MVHAFLTSMYRGNRADFVFTVTRDFVRPCQTPLLVLPDDVPAHPYTVAMESAHLAPNAEVTIYPWKANPKQIRLALRHVRAFLKANRPAAAAQRSPPRPNTPGASVSAPEPRAAPRPTDRSRQSRIGQQVLPQALCFSQ